MIRSVARPAGARGARDDFHRGAAREEVRAVGLLAARGDDRARRAPRRLDPERRSRGGRVGEKPTGVVGTPRGDAEGRSARLLRRLLPLPLPLRFVFVLARRLLLERDFGRLDAHLDADGFPERAPPPRVAFDLGARLRVRGEERLELGPLENLRDDARDGDDGNLADAFAAKKRHLADELPRADAPSDARRDARSLENNLRGALAQKKRLVRRVAFSEHRVAGREDAPSPTRGISRGWSRRARDAEGFGGFGGGCRSLDRLGAFPRARREHRPEVRPPRHRRRPVAGEPRVREQIRRAEAPRGVALQAPGEERPQSCEAEGAPRRRRGGERVRVVVRQI